MRLAMATALVIRLSPDRKSSFNCDFPAGQVDSVVRYRDIVGKIQPAPTSDALTSIDFRAGQNRAFKIDLVRKQCQSK